VPGKSPQHSFQEYPQELRAGIHTEAVLLAALGASGNIKDGKPQTAIREIIDSSHNKT
jgi:hypothetical protein